TVGGGTPVARTHDNNGNLTDDGTNLYEYDALNRLVKVTRKSDSVVIAIHGWDAQSRRVLHTVTDGINNSDLRFFYKHGALIEETNASGTLVKQHVFGGMGERAETLSSTQTLYLFEKIDGSIASYANSSKIVQSYYDYKSQGLTQVVGFGADSAFFTADDTYSSVTAGNANDYLWQGVRIDFETRHYYGTAGTRMYDPVNGRKLQSSADMWESSLWGLRYNRIILRDQGKKSVARWTKLFESACPGLNIEPLKRNAFKVGTKAHRELKLSTPYIKNPTSNCPKYCKRRMICNLIIEIFSNQSVIQLHYGDSDKGSKLTFGDIERRSFKAGAPNKSKIRRDGVAILKANPAKHAKNIPKSLLTLFSFMS
ncbi:MAG: hypothetical protein P1V97_28345, partial [Planctomycetota bacterium]|nr:hypothetical protein [Planctomycetota bacterium]